MKYLGLSFYCFGLLLGANSSAAAIELNDYESPISPLQIAADLDADKIELGDKLFHDNRLSGDNSISCAHCHNLESGGGTIRLVSTVAKAASIHQRYITPATTLPSSGMDVQQHWKIR